MFSVSVQLIAWEDRPRNDLLCVETDVKQLPTHSLCGNKVFLHYTICCFSAVMLLAGHQEEHPACKKLSDEVLALLSVWSEVHMVCIWSS